MTRSRETVIFLSHLRWTAAVERPHQLALACGRENDVVYFEEPVFEGTRPELVITHPATGVTVATPHLPCETTAQAAEQHQRAMIDRLLQQRDYVRPVLWYYAPTMLAFTHHIRATAIVYDCIDELCELGAEHAMREAMLMRHADVVFTGGHLWEHMRAASGHHNIHPVPSGADMSWDRTFQAMWHYVDEAIAARAALSGAAIVRPGTGSAPVHAVRARGL